MPKATLTFQLPEEQVEFDLAANAGKYHAALWNIEQGIRQIWKYADLTEEQTQLMDKIRAILTEHTRDLI